MIKDIVPMFYTPLYLFHMENHEEYKQEVLEFLKNPALYEKYSTAPHIKLSDGSLHREPLLQPYYQFMKECLDFTMADLGYNQKQSITSMWSTIQEKGMYHHPHTHGNTFLAGVLYFHGQKGSRGTTFMNPSNMIQIQPNIDTTKQMRLSPIYHSQFEEGDFLVFPAWTVHTTPVHMQEEPRYILGVNSMPVGKTSDEPYDRFFYPDAYPLNLDMTPEELEKYKMFSPHRRI